jgi:hypothetical protein
MLTMIIRQCIRKLSLKQHSHYRLKLIHWTSTVSVLREHWLINYKLTCQIPQRTKRELNCDVYAVRLHLGPHN